MRGTFAKAWWATVIGSMGTSQQAREKNFVSAEMFIGVYVGV